MQIICACSYSKNYEIQNDMIFIRTGTPTRPEASEDALTGNPVGELQEMTQKKLWPPPVYEFTSEQGPPHAREFICTVRLFNLAEQGKTSFWTCFWSHTRLKSIQCRV